MKGELYSPGQPLKKEDLDYAKYSIQDSLAIRQYGFVAPGIYLDSQVLAETIPFQISAGVGLVVDVGTGVALAPGLVDTSDSSATGGELIIIPAADAALAWQRTSGTPIVATGPFKMSSNGLGGYTPTPQSTGTRFIPVADNSTNYLWIGYLHAIDPSVYSLHKATSGIIYPHGLDGYDILINTSPSTPSFNGNSNYMLIGKVTTLSGAITAIDQTMMPLARTRDNRIGITIDTASPPSSYANGETKFLDDHINSMGTGPGVSENNPHNTGIVDIGLSFVDVDLVGHRKQHHSHGIIGTKLAVTSSLYPQTDNTTPVIGDIGMVFLKQLISGEEFVLEGQYFTQVQPVLLGPSGLGATGDAYVSFQTGLAAGVYTIFIKIVENSQLVLSGPLITGNTLSVTVDGTPVSQLFSGSSNATLTALAATIAGLPNVASAIVNGNTITVSPVNIAIPVLLSAASVTGGASQATTSIVVTDITPIVDKRFGLLVNANEYVICTVTWNGVAFTGAPPLVTSDLRLFGLTGTKDLQDGCVTSAKIAPGAIAEAGIGFGSVNSPAIHVTDAFGVFQADTTQGYGVKTNHIQDQNITAAKMAPLSIANSSLQTGAVTGVKIAAETITAFNIAQHAIESPELGLADNLNLGGGPQDTTVGIGVKTTHIANGAVTAAKLATSIATSFVAVGTIVMFAGAEGSMPPGYFPCDGRPLNAALFPEFIPLFNAIGNVWGGTGFIFNVPDLRGIFVRMVNTTGNGTAGGPFNDPQESTRTKRDGVSPQLGVGSYQLMDVQVHNHSYNNAGYSGTATVDDQLSNAYGQFNFTSQTGPFPVSPPAGQETRPKNAAVIYMIKY